MSVKCGHCRERHETVTEVRECSGFGFDSRPATGYRSSSTTEMYEPEQRGAYLRPEETDGYRPTNVTERTEETRQAAKVPAKVRATEGMYRKAGSIYKVQVAVHGSGKTYAKRLVELVGHKDPKTGKNKWTFEYAPGFVFELRPEHRLTVAQAKEFGALYGTCCVCGRTLTKEESIAAGIGPVCSGKMFG